MLANKRPNGIEDLPLLPCNSENLSRNKTLMRYRPSAAISLERIASLPWALAEGGALVDSAVLPLFEPPVGAAPPLPQGIRARWIDRAFAEALRESIRSSADRWFEDVLKLHRFGFVDFFRLALVPSLRAGAWSAEIANFVFELWANCAASAEWSVTTSRRHSGRGMKMVCGCRSGWSGCFHD